MFNAPAHLRHKLMSAPLSHELTASKGAKTLPVRRGDTILIKRGDHKGFEGKISRVDLKAFRIYVEGLTREKVDGTNIFLPVHPSKVEIRSLNLDDKWRKKILDRKVVTEKPKAKPATKVEKAPAKSKTAVEEEKAIEETFKEEAPTAKKAPAKKPAATKEEAPAKKEVTKKAPAAKKKEEKEAAPKAKAKTSEKTKGGQ